MFLWPNLRMCIGKRYEHEARMHHKFCSKPPRVFDEIREPKKACTMREQQLNEAERIRKVHN